MESRRPSERKLKVLVVDDEEINLLGIKRYLQRRFTVFTATTGKEGLDVLHKEPDTFLILCDHLMPEMSGIEMLAKAFRSFPRAQRVLMTGYANMDLLTEAINECRIARYVAKPARLAELDEVIEAALEGRIIQQSRRDRRREQEGESVRDLFELHRFRMRYQAIFSLPERTLYGYEALCRPDAALFPGPAALLRAAEEHRLIDALGQVTRQAAAAISDRLPAEAKLFINIHPDELLGDTLLEFTRNLGLLARRVILEITQTTSITDYAAARQVIANLRKFGIRIALDSFGSGYSGLNHLGNLGPDFVKFDRRLVQGVATTPSISRLVGHLIEYSKAEGIQTIAQGIETSDELDCPVSLGCTIGQGFLLGRPIPPERLA